MSTVIYNQRGFSLASTLVAMAIVGMLSLSLLQLQKFSTKTQKSSDAKFSRLSILKKYSSFIRDSRVAKNTVYKSIAPNTNLKKYIEGTFTPPDSQIVSPLDSYEVQWTKGYPINLFDNLPSSDPSHPAANAQLLIPGNSTPCSDGVYLNKEGQLLGQTIDQVNDCKNPQRFWKVSAKWLAIQGNDYGLIIKISMADSTATQGLEVLATKFESVFRAYNNRTIAGFNCPDGEAIKGFDNEGSPVCMAVAQPTGCQSKPSKGPRFTYTCLDWSGGCCTRWKEHHDSSGGK